MSRPDRRGRTLAVAAVALGAAWAAALPNDTTYAAWSDFATVPGTVGAGVWLTDGDPPLPEQCMGIVFARIIIGTNKDDVLEGTAGNDLIFGLQGKDILNGLGGQDCLVGGNGKDELLGGDGDDVLVGGNAKDKISGGTDDDVCDGGRGQNTLIQCETPAVSVATLFSTKSAPLLSQTESVVVAPSPDPQPVDASVITPSFTPTPTPTLVDDGEASVEASPKVPLVELPVSEPADVQPTTEEQLPPADVLAEEQE